MRTGNKFEVGTSSGFNVMASYVKNTHTPLDRKRR